MLPKTNRLPKLEIDLLKSKGKPKFSKNFTLLHLSNLDINNSKFKFPRFAIIISKKVSKKAVDRNRIKRIIREAIILNLNKISTNNDYLIIAKQSSLKLTNNEIRREVEELLSPSS